ncbi:hypothetical protein Halru_1561 [Halovivax ruber XH-70]|uniref:Uncharacterized protein n=1 Tax=Halovivax ruber (strain DSM 18193 / JCM 13892 / XH-70) TaxID=797302 RepID=L0IBH0_HALRX|nr:hypothetical protein [Halovivax ruber]AGB16168.1 hypothetical protein Halru_1561 [Halovivax ruber XH-70]
MVAVDAQILGGVAVTVLLALLFFGVVVLWDVALAIRGVADKLDKLEDTVDDDLTDMERAVSGAPGGGGPQVHLSGGGTITSGGSPRTQAGPHPSPRSDSPTGDPATDRRSPHAEGARTEPPDAARTDPSATARDQPEPSETTGPEAQDNTADPEPRRSRQSVGADPTPVRNASEVAEWPASDAEEVANAETDSADEGSTGSAEATPTGSDSTPNWGRFITSPDRTPWYRTRIDWDAVADGRSPIAGELEAGDVEPTPTDGDGDETGPSDEPIVVDPDGAATTETTAPDSQEANERDDTESEEADGTDAIGGGGDRTDDSSAPEDDAEASPGDDTDPRTDDTGERVDSPSSTAESPSPDEAESMETSDSGTETVDSITMGTAETETDGEGDVIGAGGDDASEDDFGATGTDESRAATDEVEPSEDESAAEESPTAVEPVPSESDAVDSVADEVDDRPVVDEDTSPDGEADTPPDEDVDTAQDGDDDARDGNGDVQSEEIDETPDMEFTFEEFSPDDTSEPSLTVDDAVEAVNESEPSLARSAHGVTSSAEKDDDGVVLVYDLETADAGQSTKRLLTYQLQSFANESDVDVDVSVAGNRIVVDIPDAEGTDVSQWEAAIVEVIDRTLYLSDNS